MSLQKIYFSKNGDNFKIKSEKTLQSYYEVYLESCNFKKDSQINTWNIETFDYISLIELVNQIFDSKNFEIIYDKEIKSIIDEKNENERRFDEYAELGLEIKNNQNHDLPEIGFKKGFELKPFQKLSIKHMISSPNSANFSIPGTGKTIMTLTAFKILQNQNKIDQMWVIGPIPSFKAWEDEYEYSFDKPKGLHVKRYHGSQLERDRIRNKLGKYEIVITSYDTAKNDLELIKRDWRINKKRIFLVLDESHHIKSMKEITDSGNLSNAAAMIELGKFAERRCILTGTPIPHELEGLWSQITFLWPYIQPFGNRDEFLLTLKKFDRTEIIQNIINFMWTRVSNRQLADEMPVRKEHRKGCEVVMDSKQEEIYRLIESQFLSDTPPGIEREKLQQWKRAKIIRLVQAVTNPKLIAENDPDFNLPELIIQTQRDKSILHLVAQYKKDEVPPKIKKVAMKAREIISDRKSVVIFTVFRGNVKLLSDLLLDENPLSIIGGGNYEERENTYEEFKNWDFSNGKGKILIATLGSIAESVSLHKNKDGKPVCQNVIYLERNFNGGQFMQSLYRVYRVGSDKKIPVHYYFYESILNDGSRTIDDTIDGVLNHRLHRLYDILEDEFLMEPVSLDSDEENDGQHELYGQDDNYHDIMEKINELIKSREKKN